MTTDFSDLDPLNRFSSRAALYQNRARYPHALLDYLRASCGLTPDMVIADIGSGTGFLTVLLLENGNRVYAVEPNAEMRAVADELFTDIPLFTSLTGTAEQLPIKDASVDMVTVGQALHWFEVDKARVEFQRVLKPTGKVVVVDNRPRSDDSEFMQACRAFEQKYFLDFGTAAEPPARVVKLFTGIEIQKKQIPFIFSCSEKIFRDGFLSSSLAPEAGSQAYTQCEESLHNLFVQYQALGKVQLSFETAIYCGRFK
jgi:ubiquinone/menaquinone biosynthesis C-methylase UbiE